MNQNNEIKKLNLLVLDEAEKESKKKQSELINIEESSVTFKSVRTRSRKVKFNKEDPLKTEIKMSSDILEDNFPLDDNKKKQSPKKHTIYKLAENNKKMTDIFKVDIAKQVNIIKEAEPDEKIKINEQIGEIALNEQIHDINIEIDKLNNGISYETIEENIVKQNSDFKIKEVDDDLKNPENKERIKDGLHIEIDEKENHNLLEDDEEYNKKNKKKINATKNPKPPKILKVEKENKGERKKKNKSSDLIDGEPESKLEKKNIIEPPANYDSIINLEELNINKDISNSNMILAIIEICINHQKYGIYKPNNTREFWKEVYEKTEWQNIFKKFQSETLRKYWRVIRDVDNIPKFMETVITYNNILNGNNVKLLPVINAISSFINSKAKTFDLYESQLTSNQNLSVKTKEKNKQSDLLNKKRCKDDAIKEDINEIKKKIMESDQKKSSQGEKRKGNQTLNKNIEDNVKSLSSKKKKKIIEQLTSNDDDEEVNKEIDEIINSLCKSFDNKTNDEILEIFKNTSFNIQNAYLYLTDPIYFKELGFSEPDDKIIQKLEKSTAYTKLLQLKGKEIISERKFFLKIKK